MKEEYTTNGYGIIHHFNIKWCILILIHRSVKLVVIINPKIVSKVKEYKYEENSS